MGRRWILVAVVLAASACGGPPVEPSTSLAPTAAPAATSSMPAATRSVAPTSSPSPVPSASAPPTEAQVLTALPYPLREARPNAEAAIYAIDSLWVPFYASPNGWLLRLDADTGRVAAKFPIGESPNSMAIGDLAVWVANDIGDGSRKYAGANTLNRLDLQTLRITTTQVQVGGPIAAGFGAVFVPSFENGAGNGTLAKADAATGRVVARWPISGTPVVGCGRLWVVHTLGGLMAPSVTVVTMVDPKTGQRLGEWPIIAEGVLGPAEVDGQCRLLSALDSTSGDPWRQGLQPVSVEDGGVAPATAIFTVRTRILDGQLWAKLDDGIYQLVDPSGAPAGDPVAMPAVATVDKADPYFFVAVGVGWAVGNDAAFRLILP